MAEPVDFPETNLTLVGQDPGDDSVAPVRVRLIDGTVTECWRLTPAEIAEVNRTGLIWVCIQGRTRAPLMITAHRSDVI